MSQQWGLYAVCVRLCFAASLSTHKEFRLPDCEKAFPRAAQIDLQMPALTMKTFATWVPVPEEVRAPRAPRPAPRAPRPAGRLRCNTSDWDQRAPCSIKTVTR